MIFFVIVLYIAVGAIATALSCGRPNVPRLRRLGQALLALSGAGLLGLSVTALLFYTGTCEMDTLLIVFLSILSIAVAVCLAAGIGTVFVSPKPLPRLPVLVPFLWAIPLLLGTHLCAGWATTAERGYILAFGVSLCALLLACPGAALTRAAVLFKRSDVLSARLDELKRRKEKKAARQARRAKKKRLQNAAKSQPTKSRRP